ncbi:unnamed protein product [Microthlaspi erraticum]|uniref:Uncharacterized protein n=1 Tax=Microthlaspi erraticum TaxID=1685480 RepID=A0A6D2JFH9_9BRAS|nr:unnamed protein product [Microthlaspi erraticum]
MARDTKLHGVRNSASAMRSRRISSVIHDLPSWIRPVGGVRLGILITSGMPSSLAWLTAPLFVFSESVSSPESCSSPSLCLSVSSRRSASAATLAASSISPSRPPSRPQQRPSLHPPPSSCDAPPHPLGWLHQEPLRTSGGSRRRAIEAIVSSPSSMAMPFPFLSFGFISIE